MKRSKNLDHFGLTKEQKKEKRIADKLLEKENDAAWNEKKEQENKQIPQKKTKKNNKKNKHGIDKSEEAEALLKEITEMQKSKGGKGKKFESTSTKEELPEIKKNENSNEQDPFEILNERMPSFPTQEKDKEMKEKEEKEEIFGANNSLQESNNNDIIQANEEAKLNNFTPSLLNESEKNEEENNSSIPPNAQYDYENEKINKDLAQEEQGDGNNEIIDIEMILKEEAQRMLLIQRAQEKNKNLMKKVLKEMQLNISLRKKRKELAEIRKENEKKENEKYISTYLWPRYEKRIKEKKNDYGFLRPIREIGVRAKKYNEDFEKYSKNYLKKYRLKINEIRELEEEKKELVKEAEIFSVNKTERLRKAEKAKENFENKRKIISELLRNRKEKEAKESANKFLSLIITRTAENIKEEELKKEEEEKKIEASFQNPALNIEIQGELFESEKNSSENIEQQEELVWSDKNSSQNIEHEHEHEQEENLNDNSSIKIRNIYLPDNSSKINPNTNSIRGLIEEIRQEPKEPEEERKTEDFPDRINIDSINENDNPVFTNEDYYREIYGIREENAIKSDDEEKKAQKKEMKKRMNKHKQNKKSKRTNNTKAQKQKEHNHDKKK